MKIKVSNTILLLFLSMFVISCGTTNMVVRQNVNNKVVSINGSPVWTYEIDSCEYIGQIESTSSFLAHKGNCKFCAERQKQSSK